METVAQGRRQRAGAGGKLSSLKMVWQLAPFGAWRMKRRGGTKIEKVVYILRHVSVTCARGAPSQRCVCYAPSHDLGKRDQAGTRLAINLEQDMNFIDSVRLIQIPRSMHAVFSE